MKILRGIVRYVDHTQIALAKSQRLFIFRREDIGFIRINSNRPMKLDLAEDIEKEMLNKTVTLVFKKEVENVR